VTTTDQTTPAEYNAGVRATLIEARDDGDPRFTAGRASGILQHLDYADYRGLFIGGGEIDLWGFGKTHIMFSDPDGGWWVALYSLIEPTGLSAETLRDLWDREAEEYEGESVDRINYLDGTNLPIVHHDFVMRAFAIHSPWREEYYKNTQQLMRHAMMHSGLGTLITGSPETGFTAIAELRTDEGEPIKVLMAVKAFDTDNVPIVSSPFDDASEGERMRITDLTDTYTVERASDATQAFLGPTVSEEEAVALALRGPSGPLAE
jgi:hypothetical protein